jgi:hypothetical protein
MLNNDTKQDTQEMRCQDTENQVAKDNSASVEIKSYAQWESIGVMLLM